MERSSFSRSKGSRWPLLFTTTSSRNCTRSKVVKRAPQLVHCRRLRIAELSSVGRESLTWVSSFPQNGQRIHYPQTHGDGPRPSPPINREPLAQLAHFRAHLLLDRAVVGAIGGKAIQYAHDQLADLFEFLRPKAAAGRCRRTKTDAGRDRRLLRIERNAVLVAGD